jgi:hypothetical protein
VGTCLLIFKVSPQLIVCLSTADVNAGSMDRHNFAQNESALTLFDPMTHTPCG